MKKSYNIKTFLGGAVTFLLVLVFAAPFYLLVVNSLKTTKEAYASPFSLPADVYWQSFTEVLAGAGINANFVGATAEHRGFSGSPYCVRLPGGLLPGEASRQGEQYHVYILRDRYYHSLPAGAGTHVLRPERPGSGGQHCRHDDPVYLQADANDRVSLYRLFPPVPH